MKLKPLYRTRRKISGSYEPSANTWKRHSFWVLAGGFCITAQTQHAPHGARSVLLRYQKGLILAYRCRSPVAAEEINTAPALSICPLSSQLATPSVRKNTSVGLARQALHGGRIPRTGCKPHAWHVHIARSLRHLPPTPPIIGGCKGKWALLLIGPTRFPTA